jgi:hypothetical protein
VADRSETYSYLSAEQSLSHLDVRRHSDPLVTVQRFIEQRLRFVAITYLGRCNC